MKNRILLFLLLLSFASAYAGGSKKALIIAVGDYPTESYWGKISSQKDVPLIVRALDHHGFTSDNILILRDTQATKAAIKAAFHKITREAEPDDIFVIHYSGHGQQVWDKNGDELDGKDEALVPIDAKARFIPGEYEGENHLTDDELEILVGELRMQLGKKGSLTLIFDACHSGTATRGPEEGVAPARGTKIFMGPDNWKGKAGRDEGTLKFKTNSRGSEEPEMAPMVLFSGAAASQLNYETRDEEGNFVGSLSYAISKVLLSCSSNTTNRELFDQIKSEMNVLAPKQTPQVEGDLDFKIFAGQGADRVKYFKNSQILDDKTSIVNGGHLLGLFDGTKVALYPAGTKDTKGIKPIATGHIVNSNVINADIIWDQSVNEESMRKGLVFVTEQSFSPIQVKVKLDVSGNPDLLSALQTNIALYDKVIQIDNQKPDVIVEMNNKYSRGNQVQMINNNEMVIFEQPFDPGNKKLAGDITKGLLAYAQAQFLRKLATANEDIHLDFELIPITEVKVIEEGQGRLKKTRTVEVSRGNVEDFMGDDGTLVLKPGDHFKVKVTNKGREPAFFTLIDIQPDNQINILLPGNGLTGDELKVLPGESKEIDQVFEIFPPYGEETFKLIATKSEVDLSMIVNSRGEKTEDENPSPFEQLFQSTYVQSRGAGPKGQNQPNNIPSDAAHISKLIFRIEKR